MKNIFIACSAGAQDSVKVTISVQARDLDYCGSFMFSDNALENVYDSVKVKFRVQNPPNGTTAVSVTAYTVDWIALIGKLNLDIYAIKANTFSRVETLLRGVGQPYLTGKLDAMAAADQDHITALRLFGRSKNRRQ
jgi:hypothetical protein